ncbi:TPA: hypothetical protein R8G79_000901 [Citrobacter amalonaticus]|nr:hypothetical protein [Citrobacter amalonaticus]
MNKKILAVLASISLTSGCAGQEALKKQTQSGKPEGYYHNTTKEKVRDALVSYCNNQGLMVFSSDNSAVICGKEQTGGGAILSQALLGNAYSTTPVAKVRFTISQLSDDVKVWADMWIETQMAMGQMQQAQVTSNEAKNTIQDRLDNLRP